MTPEEMKEKLEAEESRIRGTKSKVIDFEK